MRANAYLLPMSLAVAMLGACSPPDDGVLVIHTVSEYDETTSMAGIQVQVNDLPWVTTDEQGRAEFPDVEPPYDVRIHQVIVSPASNNRYDDIWSLRDQTDDPLVIRVDGSFADTFRIATLTGQLQGRAAPDARTIPMADATGAFELQYRWDGPSPIEVTLDGFEIDESSAPIQFLGYGRTTVTVDAPLVSAEQPDVVIADVDIELTPVTQYQVSGPVTVPVQLAAYPVEGTLRARFDDRTQYLYTSPLLGDPLGFAQSVPDIPDATLIYSAYSQGEYRPGPENLFLEAPWSYAELHPSAATDSAELVLPDPVTLQEPAEDATITADTVFRWSPVAGAGRTRMTMKCASMDGDQRVLTNFRTIEPDEAGTEAVLPDIPDAVLPVGSACEWSVIWYSEDGVWRSSSSGSRVVYW